MDGSLNSRMTPAAVEARVHEIRTLMPSTYSAIQDRAARIGRQVYRQVRRGVAGHPNEFWAMERGHVVGTPFAQHDITADVALRMVQFGPQHVVIWGTGPEGAGADGAD